MKLIIMRNGYSKLFAEKSVLVNCPQLFKDCNYMRQRFARLEPAQGCPSAATLHVSDVTKSRAKAVAMAKELEFTSNILSISSSHLLGKAGVVLQLLEGLRKLFDRREGALAWASRKLTAAAQLHSS